MTSAHINLPAAVGVVGMVHGVIWVRRHNQAFRSFVYMVGNLTGNVTAIATIMTSAVTNVPAAVGVVGVAPGTT